MDDKKLKLEKIKEILRDEYKWYHISEQRLDDLADECYYTLFASRNELSEVMVTLLHFEQEIGMDEMLSGALCAFCFMLKMLENNEVTAQRLYDSFMNEFDCLDTFVKLHNENAEYISAEKLAKAKEKAFGTFDSFLLKVFGIKE